MHTSRRLAINAGLVLLILAALVAGYFLIGSRKAASADATTQTQLTAVVKKGTVATTISASGNVAPVSEMTADFTVAGTVAKIDVKLGQKVKADATLATLETGDLETAVAAAKTTLANSENTLVAAKSELADAEDAAEASDESATSAQGGSGSGGASSVTSASSQVTSAQQQVDSAQSALDKAEDDLAAATLTAPMAGVVVAISGTAGSAVSAASSSSAQVSGDSSGSSGSSDSGSSDSSASGSGSSSGSSSGFITIADESKLILSAAVPESDIDSVKVGQAVSTTFPALPGVTQSAKVTAIAPTATTSSGVVTYATTVTLDDVPAKLRVGESADAVITTSSSPADALYVPATAITTSGSTKTVKVVGTDGKTSSVTVTTGVAGTNGTEVKSGLKLGQTVVIGSVSSSTTTGTTGTSPEGTGNLRGGFGGSGGFGEDRTFGGGAAGGR